MKPKRPKKRADPGTPVPLPASALQRRCDPASLPFETTDQLPDVSEALGQERAVEALRFGLTMPHEGYNLFILGREGSGRHHLADRLVREEAERRPTGRDWCYLYDFAHPNRPRALALPAGDAPRLRADMDRLVEDLGTAIEAAFRSDAYRARRQALEDELRARTEREVRALGDEASRHGLVLLQSPNNLALVPARDGRALAPEDVARLPDEERAEIAANSRELGGKVEALIRRFPQWQQEHRDRVRTLDRGITQDTVTHLVNRLRAAWQNEAQVLDHLDAVQADVIEHTPHLMRAEADGDHAVEALTAPTPLDWRTRYKVNVLVERLQQAGAPVVHLDHPTLPALVGRIEHRTHLGTLFTDFTRIQAGALHEANGGYLILDAASVLREPMAWNHLKRALRARQIRIESVGEALALVTTVTLQPEPIPLDLKVVLIGEPSLYYLLSALDPEFPRLFKVMANVEPDAPRTRAHELHLAHLVATLARSQGLRAFDRGAVARVIDHAARVRGDASRLTTHMQTLDDLLREADHHAGERGAETVTTEDVRGALAAAKRRAGLLQERTLEALERDLVHVATSGEVVGQVNGLMVVGVRPVPFGRPGRVSATVHPGSGQVVDIEREVKLGGPIHSKGVLILTGFLGGRYADGPPLALNASLVFEQSYGPVEGDSASLAEACALLSAIAGLPLRQDLAVTGAIDQRGRVQAVGGVNEKIEGFHALCDARGLTGTQGVIVPASVAPLLMLDDAVVASASAGRFHVWAVATIDEAMALLTGHPASEVDARVRARLASLAEQARERSRPD